MSAARIAGSGHVPLKAAATAGALILATLVIMRKVSMVSAASPAKAPATALHPRVSLALTWRVVRLSALAGVLGFLSTALFLGQGEVFQSPDETSNHLFTETFAKTGKLWYENELLQFDEENLLHPRGVLTYEGRAVPFNFLGLPVMYGALYTVFGEHVKYIGMLFAACVVFFLYKTAAELFGARLEDAIAVMIGCTPLLDYFNRPYMNSLPAIACFSLALWVLARYLRRSDARYIVPASIALSLSMLFRYEYVLFTLPLTVLVCRHKYGTFRTTRLARDVSIIVGIVAVSFVFPVLLLNEFTYGNWRTYGYGLFNDVYYPVEHGGAGGGWRAAVDSARSILVPSPPAIGSLSRSLLRFTLLLMPVFSLLAIAGGWKVLRTRKVAAHMVVLWGALLGYFLCYRGSSDTWGAQGMAPDFDAAIVRYWLPFYVGMFMLALFALTNTTSAVLRSVLTVLIVGTGLFTLEWGYSGNLSEARAALERAPQWSQEVLIPATEDDAIVYSGRSDKRVTPYRYSAAWWNGAEFYDPDLVARSMARVIQAGRKVYIVRDPEVDLGRLNQALRPFGLTASKTQARGLLAVRPDAGVLTLEKQPRE